jgi:2,5-dihydroxypyridine 5,6-dioxygenase
MYLFYIIHWIHQVAVFTVAGASLAGSEGAEMSDNSELVKLYGAVLDLCKVSTGEVLAVLTEGSDRAHDADAYLAAAEERGAHALQVNLRKRAPAPGIRVKQTSLTGNEPAIETLKAADIVIDLVGLLWSAEQKKIQEAGARILMSREQPDVIRRMFPTEGLRRRVEAGEKILSSAREMRIVSAAGTDITYCLGQYPVITQYGYTDQSGRWDNLPGGFLYTGGNDGAINGVVVLNTGDIIFPFKRYLSNPIRMIVEKGMVTRIEGDHVDAELLRAFMSRWNDPRAYAVSHIGWGMDDKAQWDFMATSPLGAITNGVDGRSFYGNVLFSTGPNAELGGSNDTGCHLDLPLRGCDLFLDNQPIVKAGQIVSPSLRAESR